MKLLLYCTKGKPYLYCVENYFICDKTHEGSWGDTLNGKIVGECDFEVEEINPSIYPLYNGYIYDYPQEEEKLKCTCLSAKEMYLYLHRKCNQNGYAIHIENLHIFSSPRELSFYYQKYKNDKHLYNVEKAPKNMMIVIGKQGDKYVLISIHPEWLCKILNGEKTIEIRKKVLKEMIENE